jgi:hypothetical protein
MGQNVWLRFLEKRIWIFAVKIEDIKSPGLARAFNNRRGMVKKLMVSGLRCISAISCFSIVSSCKLRENDLVGGSLNQVP